MPLLAACRSLDGSAGIIIDTMLPETAGTLIGGVGRRFGVAEARGRPRGPMLDRKLHRRRAAHRKPDSVRFRKYLGAGYTPQLGAHAHASPRRGLSGAHGGTVPGPGGGSAWRVPRRRRPGAI
jgi:hypothetical protein